MTLQFCSVYLCYRDYFVGYLEFSTYTFTICKQIFIVAIYLFLSCSVVSFFQYSAEWKWQECTWLLVPDLKQGEFSLSLLDIMLAVGCILLIKSSGWENFLLLSTIYTVSIKKFYNLYFCSSANLFPYSKPLVLLHVVVLLVSLRVSYVVVGK